MRAARNFALLPWVAAYVGLFWVVYLQVAPTFASAYLAYSAPPAAPTAGCLALIGFCALGLPSSIERPSQVVYWLLFVLVVVPALIVPLLARERYGGDLATVLTYGAAVALCFRGLGLIYRAPLPQFRRLSVGVAFWPIFAAGAAVVYGIILVASGFRFNLVGLDDVYDRRSEFSIATGRSVALGYAAVWAGNIVNPVLIVRGMTRQKVSWLAAGVVGQLLVYSLTAFRTVLFSSILIGGLLWLLSGQRRRFVPWLLMGSALLMVGATVADRVLGSVFFTSVVTRRTFMQPGVMSGLYAEFFSNNDKAVLAHSIFAPVASNPYRADPASVIGEAYFAGSGASANANLWADGFANFGYPGMVVATAALALILLTYDGLARNLDVRFMAMLLAIPALTLSNTGVLTSLLTHGLGLALVVAWVIPRSGLVSHDWTSARMDRLPGPPQRKPQARVAANHELRPGITPKAST